MNCIEASKQHYPFQNITEFLKHFKPYKEKESKHYMLHNKLFWINKYGIILQYSVILPNLQEWVRKLELLLVPFYTSLQGILRWNTQEKWIKNCIYGLVEWSSTTGRLLFHYRKNLYISVSVIYLVIVCLLAHYSTTCNAISSTKPVLFPRIYFCNIVFANIWFKTKIIFQIGNNFNSLTESNVFLEAIYMNEKE